MSNSNTGYKLFFSSGKILSGKNSNFFLKEKPPTNYNVNPQSYNGIP